MMSFTHLIPTITGEVGSTIYFANEDEEAQGGWVACVWPRGQLVAALGFRAHISDHQAPGFVRSPPALTELQGTFLDTTVCGYVFSLCGRST